MTEDEMAGWHHRFSGRWVWVNSGSWWWTGRPGVLQFMGLQRVGHDWATELNSMVCKAYYKLFYFGETDRLLKFSLSLFKGRWTLILLKVFAESGNTTLVFSPFGIFSQLHRLFLSFTEDSEVAHNFPFHPKYCNYMSRLYTSCTIPSWMNHKLESRLSGEISIPQICRWHYSNYRKVKWN